MIYLNKYQKKRRKVPMALALILIFNLCAAPVGSAAEEWKPVFESNELQEKVVSEDKLDKKISLDYKNADLATVLRSLSWTYDLNIVTGPKVKGKVTISLKDIAVRDALEAILTINGLIFSERAGIIYVITGDPKAIDMNSEVIFLKYLSASEALNLLRNIGSSKGDMKINELSNSLIVTDFPKNIAKIKKLLVQVDIAPKQVLIEAKIVDITSSDLAAMGITMTPDYNPGHGLFDRDNYFAERLTGTLSMAEQSELTGGQLVISAFTMKNLSVPMTIDALVRDGRAKLLASPSIAVLSGEEARIIIGEKYPISERTQTTTGTTETVTFVDIGTSLRVTPTINDDDYITMRVHPEVSSTTSVVGGNPRITTREADTTVRVKEGETLVIGGLIKHTDTRTHEKIPILGDIPILGFLFSRFSKTIEQIELAVFITPTILRSQEEKARLGKKNIARERSYNILETTANLSIVESLFDRARALDMGRGIESIRKRKAFRKTQALNIYGHIVTQFPETERAAEAVYRAGMIQYQDFKDYESAKEVFAILISDYPDSKFAKRANKIYKKIILPTKSIRKPRPIGLDILSGG